VDWRARHSVTSSVHGFDLSQLHSDESPPIGAVAADPRAEVPLRAWLLRGG
jgi:hypothetical protein